MAGLDGPFLDVVAPFTQEENPEEITDVCGDDPNSMAVTVT